MGWITWIIMLVTASFMSTKWYLRNRKHFPCFHKQEISRNFFLGEQEISILFLNTGKNLFCFFYKITHNTVYVNSVSQALITMAQRPHKAEDRFCRFYCFFRVVFWFGFFLEPPKPILYRIYTISNVKFLSFVEI